jgi:hypothetical protein
MGNGKSHIIYKDVGNNLEVLIAEAEREETVL